MSDYRTIAESKNFIVLERYTKDWQVNENYQSEGDLEREFIQDLVHQGYEAPLGLNTPEALLTNVRVQLQTLNDVQFSNAEWQRFVETWLDKPSDGIVEKTRKVHDGRSPHRAPDLRQVKGGARKPSNLVGYLLPFPLLQR
ncbi:MAG: hypothetical protein JSR40_06305 [Proteobacteria bacterium]|nr:hypothetical protein [Pseudomonadota bacterium]